MTKQPPSAEVVTTHSSHEEADAKMVYVASQIARTGLVVHIYSPDTDVLILLLSVLPSLGLDTVLITGSGENRRNVKLRYIYDELGEN